MLVTVGENISDHRYYQFVDRGREPWTCCAAMQLSLAGVREFMAVCDTGISIGDGDSAARSSRHSHPFCGLDTESLYGGHGIHGSAISALIPFHTLLAVRSLRCGTGSPFLPQGDLALGSDFDWQSGKRSCAQVRARIMRVVILGGTRFIGRRVDGNVGGSKGEEVTLFIRGANG